MRLFFVLEAFDNLSQADLFGHLILALVHQERFIVGSCGLMLLGWLFLAVLQIDPIEFIFLPLEEFLLRSECEKDFSIDV